MVPLIRAASFSERLAYHESGHAVAALTFSIPIIRVTVDPSAPAMHRGRYVAPRDLGVETMTTMTLAGPAAEVLFCGPITDGGDKTDLEMARGYLARKYDALGMGIALRRHADAADRLVRTPWAFARIQLIAAALLRMGTLTGDEINGL